MGFSPTKTPPGLCLHRPELLTSRLVKTPTGTPHLPVGEDTNRNKIKAICANRQLKQTAMIQTPLCVPQPGANWCPWPFSVPSCYLSYTLTGLQTPVRVSPHTATECLFKPPHNRYLWS